MGTEAASPASGGGETAPVETAPVESVETPSAEVDSVESVQTPEQTGPTPDDFDWDGWDGSDSLLPEPIRPWVKGAAGYYTKQSELARQEAEKVQAIYEGLLAGREDPRLSEFRTKYEQESTQTRELRTQLEAAQKEHQDFVAQFEAWQHQQATSAMEAFQKENAWIFENEALVGLGSQLVEEGFHYTQVPQLLRLPEDVVARSRELLKELHGAKDAPTKAVQFAIAEAQVPKPSPHNPAAQLVSGGDRQPNVQLVHKTASQATSVEEARQIAAENAYRRHQGRR